MEFSRKNIALTGAIITVAAASAWKAWSCGGGDYDIAPNLFGYPERHAVKRLQELLHESSPQGDSAEGDLQYDADLNALTKALPARSKDEVLKLIDKALSDNRAKGYRANRANYLWDMRDLVAGGARETAPHDEWTDYAVWRMDAVQQEKRGLPPETPGLKPRIDDWLPVDEKKKLQDEYQAGVAATLNIFRTLDEKLAKASPALMPHWLVVRGGVAFRKGQLDEAEKSFKSVVEKYHDHPRAETAAFMLMRVKIEQARRVVQASRATSGPEDNKAAGPLKAADDAITEFSKSYPKSRYAPEIAGWQGALATLWGNPWSAIPCYLEQLDRADHPEVIESACHELERCFEDISNATELEAQRARNDYENVELAQQIARRPVAAMRMIYFLLDGVSSVDLSKWQYHFTSVDEIRQMISRSRDHALLLNLAHAVVAQEQLYSEPLWKPKFLAILAWAATETGEHAQAVALCENSPALLESSDDLQLVHGVALERQGRFAEAAKAYRALEEKFPQSPLLAGLPMRLANMLQKTGRSGDALLELRKAFDPGGYDEASLLRDKGFFLNDGHEVEQMTNAIAWFAPLPEMEKIAPLLPVQPGERKLRAPSLVVPLRTRLLAREEFDKAHALLDPPDDYEEQYERNGESSMIYGSGFTPRRWEKWVKPIAELHAALAQAKDAASQAQLCWALANAWEDAKGKITYPGVQSFVEYTDPLDDDNDGGLVLRQNGLAMGYSPAAIHAELDAIDELSHTVSYCLRAAELAKGTPLAARALYKANECLQEMAVHTPYQQARAYETGAARLSRSLYDRLQREHPGSQAARQAVWWTFASLLEAPGATTDLRPRHDYYSRNLVAAMLGGKLPEAEHFQDPPSSHFIDWSDDRTRQDILHPLSASAQSGSLSLVRQQIQKLNDTYRPRYGSLYGAGLFNYLADFEALLSRPGLDESAVRQYIVTRLNGDIPDASEDTMKPLADFIAYQNNVRQMSPNTRFSIATGPANSSLPDNAETLWRKFLSDCPQSAKREAALFQLARVMAREYHHARSSPEAEDDEPAAVPWLPVPARGLFTAFRLLPLMRAAAALGDYEKSYPNGRYRADIHLLRGRLALDISDYPMALQMLCETFDDPQHQELQPDTAPALADCFEQLEEPGQRVALMTALVGNASALQRFHLYVHSNVAGGALRTYEGFIDELAKTK